MRSNQEATLNDDSYSFVDTLDRTDNDLCWPAPSGDTGFRYPVADYAELPGYVALGYQTTTADETRGQWSQGEPEPLSHELFSGEVAPNPAFGGQSANANRNPVGYGGVESNTVENFELTGDQIKLRRRPESSYGPVGYSDYSGFLAQALVQDAYYTPYDDAAHADILASF